MVMEAQTNGPLKGMPNGLSVNGLNINGLSLNGPFANGSPINGLGIKCPSINGLSNNCSESSDPSSQHPSCQHPISQHPISQHPSSQHPSPPVPSSSASTVPSPQPCHSPRLMQSPVFFQTSPPAGVTSVPYYPSLSPRSPISSGAMVSYPQVSSHHVYTSQTSSPHHGYPGQGNAHHVYTSQHSLGSHYCNSAGKGWYPSNTIIINPAGSAPGQGGGGGRVTPVGCPTPGRITPGRITPGRTTPVYTMAMKKRYVDIMLASTASTVAIDNKIEQAMDLVKSHLMFAVREEVDVLKERIGELMERINHLEYENTVLRKYATQEALQQIQQQHGGAPNP